MGSPESTKKPTPVQSPTGQGPAAGPSSTPTTRATPGKTRDVPPGACHAVGCKRPDKRMSFCDEHYEHFKFGLIKRTGDPVPDFERKFEHYLAHQRRVAQKAA